MFFRVFAKAMRWIAIAIIAVLLLLCILYAVLQSKWAKVQIQEKIALYLKESGVDAKVEEIQGQPPFSWHIKEIDLQLGENSRLKLCDLKLRFAILPLLKGRVTIDSLKVAEAEYSFSFFAEPNRPLTAAELKTLLEEQLREISIPFSIRMNHFMIERLNFVNRDRGLKLCIGAAGSAYLRKERQEFSFNFALFSPEENKTHLEAFIAGSEKSNFIFIDLDLHTSSISPLLSLGFDADVVAKLELKGPWTSYREMLYGLPLSQAPLRGEFKGKMTNTHTQHHPLLDRDWKFKTEFSLLSNKAIDFHKLLLLSDLLHLSGKINFGSDLQRSSAHLGFSMPNLSLFSPLIAGSTKGKADLQEGHFNASFEAQDLAVNHFAAGAVQGTIEGSAIDNSLLTKAKISAAEGEIPFQSSFDLRYLPQNRLSITDFHWSSASAKGQGHLYCNLQDGTYEGSLTADVKRLESLGSLIDEKRLAGKIFAELNLSAESGEQQATCVFVARNIRYKEALLDDLTMHAEVEDLFGAPRGKMSLLAEKVYTPSFYLSRLNFGTQSDEIQWPFYLDVEGRIENPFSCYAKGFWSLENSLFTLELTRLFGDLAEVPFSLRYPSMLEWGTSDLNLSPFDFKIGRGNLFSTFELSPVRSLGTWELNHFPLEILGVFRPRFSLGGLVSSSGYFDISENTSEGVLNAVLEEANVLHFGKKEPFRAKGSLQAHLNQKTMQIHTALSASDAQFLDFNASLPFQCTPYPFKLSLDKAGNTSAELIAEGKLQDLFDFVNLGTNHFTGLLSCHLFLSQTLDSPSLKGKLELQNGSYENYFTGIHLRNIDAEFEAQNDVILLTSLEATDEKSGAATAEGKILLQPEKDFPYAFEAEMRDLHAVGFDMIDCNLTGPLYITGDVKQMDAQGNFLVETAKIQITERLPYEIPSMKVTYINTPVYLTPPSPKGGFDFHMDLELTAEKNVRVEGRGLNAELEGNVHIYGTNTNVAANGTLKLVKGEYVFSGKVFKLTDGEVVFIDKPTPSSYLHLNGTLNLPDIAITAMLRGPLMAPQLTFQSNPQKPTSSILALILFNKDITEISHPEAIQLASVLVSLSGGAGPDVLETIRKTIGIDRLNISSKPGSDEIAVQIGKYLTRGIMITLSQSATSSQVIVEVELPKGFVFQAETQEEEEGKFSLKWRKTY